MNLTDEMTTILLNRIGYYTPPEIWTQLSRNLRTKLHDESIEIFVYDEIRNEEV